MLNFWLLVELEVANEDDVVDRERGNRIDKFCTILEGGIK